MACHMSRFEAFLWKSLVVVVMPHLISLQGTVAWINIVFGAKMT